MNSKIDIYTKKHYFQREPIINCKTQLRFQVHRYLRQLVYIILRRVTQKI